MLEVDFAARLARRSQAQDRARFGQRMRHRHEVVLAADAAHDSAVRERIGHRCAEPGDHHRRVDEARMAALRHLQFPLVAVQLVDEADAAHREQPALARPACCAALRRSLSGRRRSPHRRARRCAGARRGTSARSAARCSGSSKLARSCVPSGATSMPRSYSTSSRNRPTSRNSWKSTNDMRRMPASLQRMPACAR